MKSKPKAQKMAMPPALAKAMAKKGSDKSAMPAVGKKKPAGKKPAMALAMSKKKSGC